MSAKKILIVDYDIQSLAALVRLFEPYGFEIIEARDGLTAFEKFKSDHPDLVLLEAILPKFHGFDLTRRIHQESKGTVPVVIVTGLYRGPQYRHEALTSFGASDYFEKPYVVEKLVRSVLSLLKEKIEIELDLPHPDSVISYLAEWLKKQGGAPGGQAEN
jgi:DNA-binding response OmpR family regulator